MFINQTVRQPLSFMFFFMLILIISSCNKEIIEENVPTISSNKIETQKSLEDYPAEITIDNWEDFIYAPQSVIDHFTQKQIEKQASKEYKKQDIPSLPSPSTRSMIVAGKVTAFRSNQWLFIGNVDMKMGGELVTRSYEFPVPYGGDYINYIFIKEKSGPLCMSYDTPVLNHHEVNTIDLVIIERHIKKYKRFTNVRQFLAADINRDGYITNDDMLELQDIILSKSHNFSNSDNVLFIPEEEYEGLQRILEESGEGERFAFYLEGIGTSGNCIGSSFSNRRVIKTGDVDGTFSF